MLSQGNRKHGRVSAACFRSLGTCGGDFVALPPHGGPRAGREPKEPACICPSPLGGPASTCPQATVCPSLQGKPRPSGTPYPGTSSGPPQRETQRDGTLRHAWCCGQPSIPSLLGPERFHTVGQAHRCSELLGRCSHGACVQPGGLLSLHPSPHRALPAAPHTWQVRGRDPVPEGVRLPGKEGVQQTGWSRPLSLESTWGPPCLPGLPSFLDKGSAPRRACREGRSVVTWNPPARVGTGHPNISCRMWKPAVESCAGQQPSVPPGGLSSWSRT